MKDGKMRNETVRVDLGSRELHFESVADEEQIFERLENFSHNVIFAKVELIHIVVIEKLYRRTVKRREGSMRACGAYEESECPPPIPSQYDQNRIKDYSALKIASSSRLPSLFIYTSCLCRSETERLR